MISIRKTTAATVLSLATFTGVTSYSQNKPPQIPTLIEKKVLPFIQPDKKLSPALPGESVITDEVLRKDLTFLARDKNRGRQAGEGILEREVTEYIENIFKELDLRKVCDNGKSYRQSMIIDWVDKKDPLKDFHNVKAEGQRQKGLSKADKDAVLIPAEKKPENLSREAIRTHNLVALIEGSDEKLKDTYIVLCAHMDHVGIDRLAKPGEDYIYNGADDNGSGTTVVLSNARAINQAKKDGFGPKRSIIILLATAEEMGLLGSKFFVENPPVPLDRISAMINLDMVGRMERTCISVLDTDNTGMPNFFHYEHDAIAKATGIERIDHNIEFGRRRSDQAHFADKRIPFLLIFEGLEPNGMLHKDYHGVSDEVGKIDFAKMLRVSRFTYRHVLRAANWKN